MASINACMHGKNVTLFDIIITLVFKNDHNSCKIKTNADLYAVIVRTHSKSQ